jgi:hypothetical protein
MQEIAATRGISCSVYIAMGEREVHICEKACKATLSKGENVHYVV